MTPTGRLLAVGVVAGAAGDPSLEDVGEREEELLDPLLDPAGGGAGEDGEMRRVQRADVAIVRRDNHGVPDGDQLIRGLSSKQFR